MGSFKTKNGYNYFDVLSAFQKSIRRCEEEEAVFWGIELFETGQTKVLWDRIFIIVQEDIGLAEPMMNTIINSMYQSYIYLETNRPQKISKRLVLLNAIITLARCKKSRYIDLSYMVYWHKHEEIAKNHKVPDYTYDMHTFVGKKKGRGIEHFYSEGALINNRAEIEGERTFEELAKQIDYEIEQESKKPQQKPDLFNEGQ